MGWNSDGTWTAESDDVSKQVTGLMSQDSALMRQARTSGLTTANRRGLINSSIAVGASQDAALKYAVPIASQTASQISTSNNTAASLTAQQKLNQANIDADAEKQKLSIASQEKIADLDRKAEADKTASTLAAQERATLADLITKSQDSYTSGITNTLQNADISSTTRNSAQADIANLYTKSMNVLQGLYGTTLNWGTASTGSTPTTSSPSSSISDAWKNLIFK